MRNLFILLGLGLVVCLSFAFSDLSTTVKFYKGDWDSSKKKAAKEAKLYFVDFDASYCATCRTMEETTYMDEKLAKYMAEHVVAKKVDVQDFDGVLWSQQYEVEALPTMLIFDQEGDLVERLVGYKSADALLKIFKDLQKNNSTQDNIQPVLPDTPISLPEEQKKNIPANSKYNKGSFKSADLSALQSIGHGLYEVEVNKIKAIGFSVQVGVFSTYKSVMDQADKFNRKYSKKTLIHLDDHNGSIVYKLLVGVFENKQQASAFRTDLRKDKLDGMIKDLSILG